jgi:hypothetical protein
MVKTIQAIYDEVIPTIKSSREATNCDILYTNNKLFIDNSDMFAGLSGVVGFKFSFKVRCLNAQELVDGN